MNRFEHAEERCQFNTYAYLQLGEVRSHRTSSNHCDEGVSRPGKVQVSSGRFDHTEPPRTTVMGKQAGKWVVQAHRTSSNLPEPHHYNDSNVFRVLSHEFGVVRLYRTFSIYIVRGETRYSGCLCTSSGWFKHIEPRRTFSNHIITEIARCVQFFHMSLGWFDHTEPSLSTSLQGKQGVQGAYALVRGGSSTSNLVEPSRTTSLQR